MSAVSFADFRQHSLDAGNALAELATISLQEYDHRIELARDRAVARCSDLLVVADAWPVHPGEREAAAAYIAISNALEVCDVMWWLFEPGSREQNRTLDVSRRLTHMRGLLTKMAPMALALGAAMDDLSPEELH